MPTVIKRRYSFEAAHWLPGVPPEHKCHRMHGHNYEFIVEMSHKNGTVDPATGFVIDFWDLDTIVGSFIGYVDHRCLNDIKGLENPTAENIAFWFYYKINDSILLPPECSIVSVEVFETKNCSAIYTEEK